MSESETLPQIIAIIPAAGSGTRMGSDLPKVLLPLGQQTILARTLEKILSHRRIASCIVLSPAEQLEQFEAEVRNCALATDSVAVIAGGCSRQASVLCALEYLEKQGVDFSQVYLLIHDAARCFLSIALMDRLIDSLPEHDAVTAGVPVTDSLVEVVSGQTISRHLDRSVVQALQTPQLFKGDLLLKGHRSGVSAATDDTALVRPFSEICVVAGERENFKLTTPADYRFAQFLVTQE